MWVGRGKAKGEGVELDDSELQQGAQLKDSGSGAHRLAAQAVGLAAILWIAGGAFVLQRPLARVQSEARIIQMAG